MTTTDATPVQTPAVVVEQPAIQQSAAPTSSSASTGARGGMQDMRRALIGELRVRIGDNHSSPTLTSAAATRSPQPGAAASTSSATGGIGGGQSSPQASGGAGDDELSPLPAPIIQSFETADQGATITVTSRESPTVKDTANKFEAAAAATKVPAPESPSVFLKPMSSFRMVSVDS